MGKLQEDFRIFLEECAKIPKTMEEVELKKIVDSNKYETISSSEILSIARSISGDENRAKFICIASARMGDTVDLCLFLRDDVLKEDNHRLRVAKTLLNNDKIIVVFLEIAVSRFGSHECKVEFLRDYIENERNFVTSASDLMNAMNTIEDLEQLRLAISIVDSKRKFKYSEKVEKILRKYFRRTNRIINSFSSAERLFFSKYPEMFNLSSRDVDISKKNK